jgi:beta-phosphoglucomutase
MINCILFDLDGVLVDACDWHYEALNTALISSGYDPISRIDHIEKFNGLPTKVKLSMLGIPESESIKINQLKQKHTIDIITNTATVMQEKVQLHKYLKSKNIKIGCVTNSIRETAELMLKTTGQYPYIDILISNEDVKHNKPSPDCYNIAIEKLNVNFDDVVCVEDSDTGIQAAKNSKAKHLMIVENTKEVNIHSITTKLETINNENFNTNGG